jgi:hypothetical protein
LQNVSSHFLVVSRFLLFLCCSSWSGCKFICLLQSLFHGFDVLCRWFFLSHSTCLVPWTPIKRRTGSRMLLDSSMRITVLDKRRLDFPSTSWCLVDHLDSFWQTIMYDEVIEEGFDSGLYSLVSCWNSYGIPCGMVGYDKDVLIKSCKPKLHIYNNKTNKKPNCKDHCRSLLQ